FGPVRSHLSSTRAHHAERGSVRAARSDDRQRAPAPAEHRRPPRGGRTQPRCAAARDIRHNTRGRRRSDRSRQFCRRRRMNLEALMDTFTIAGKTFTSRLIVGTGKYSSHVVMANAHRASGAEMVTVAVRRVNLADRSKESLLDYIDT